MGERGAHTQRRILDAALEVFGTHGFHNARVELITEASGCSRPAFYQYFSDKDDVFWTLAAELGAEMVALADRLGTVHADRPPFPDCFKDVHDDSRRFPGVCQPGTQSQVQPSSRLARGISGGEARPAPSTRSSAIIRYKA